LREELRKVQSSAALLEKQRNPGIGYYGVARADGGGSAAAASRSSLDLPAQNGQGNGSAPGSEDVNLEYIRNVILQFLEHENMRVRVDRLSRTDEGLLMRIRCVRGRQPNLVRVLSAVLHFSPQETRRLIAKV
jgi:hypothetical protein